MTSPYVIKAIGDSATMASAMDIPGGVTDSVRGQGAQSTIEQRASVSITALHTLPDASLRSPRPGAVEVMPLTTSREDSHEPAGLPRGPALHRLSTSGCASSDDGVVRIGITAFAQDALGDVVYVSLPAVGDTVSAGDACGEVESTKSVSDLYAPLAGEVTGVNDALDATPELVNTDPYGDGWMYELRPADAARRRGADGRRGIPGAARLRRRPIPVNDRKPPWPSPRFVLC